MDENKNPQTQPEAAQDPGKPLSEKRKAALLRYMTILFSAAFVLVLISLILQMHSSEAKISELNAASTSALSNAEALQAENRSLQDEKIALEQENKELQAKLDELNEKHRRRLAGRGGRRCRGKRNDQVPAHRARPDEGSL